MKRISYEELYLQAEKLATKVNKKYSGIYAVPRGGVPIGILLSQLLQIPMVDKVGTEAGDVLIVDDLIDSGETLKQYPLSDCAVLYKKPWSPMPTYWVEETEEWLEFPYEETQRDETDNIVRMLETLGENPNREGLKETPKRVMKFYREFLSPPEFTFTTFEGEEYDEMIIQKDIPFFSLCEHHMAPFFGTATVAYIPNGKIVGLSKLARTVDLYARRLQNQERITSQIATRLQEELEPRGVAVTLKARHFCMEMRGVKTHDVHTVTSKLTGFFKDDPKARAEYLEYAK